MSSAALLLFAVALIPACGGSESTASAPADASAPVSSPAPPGTAAPPGASGPLPPAGDTAAPSTPANVSGIPLSSTSASLSWSASTDNVGVAGYRIARDGNVVGTSAGTNFTDIGLSPGSVYEYRVIAYDAAGNVSSPSVAVRVATPSGSGRVLAANPGNYLSLLRTLQPGDTLQLAAGNYDDPSDVPGLPIFNLHGTAAQPIVITGPQTGPRAVLLGRSTHNTVRFSNASHVIVRHLDIDGRNLGGAGVAAQGLAHNITLEHLRIRGVGDDQQTVGISTVGSTVWNWTIRRNVIEGAGTGIYLGSSDGRSPFIAGIIEHNLIRDSIGYNMQIKHQLPRPTNLAGMPTQPSKTIIRHNVFHKSGNSSTGALARPNVLIGHLPLSGPGTDDLYEIYGNFFYQNPSEALFQGEGNIAFYSNVLLNDFGSAINIQPHNDVPRFIRVFGNTVVARDSGIRVSGGATTSTQKVVGNAVFAASPVTATDQSGNVVGTYAGAAIFLVNPTGALGQLDLSPKAGQLGGTTIDASGFSGFSDAALDFNRRTRDWTLRGAYGSTAVASDWRLALEIKP